MAATVVDTAVSQPRRTSSLDDGKLSVAKLDEHQVVAYDLAPRGRGGRGGPGHVPRTREHGEVESMLARAFVADAVSDIVGRGSSAARRSGASTRRRSRPRDAFVTAHRAPAFLEALADQCAKHGTGPTHLDDDFELVADTFRRFADDKIRPVAEHVHRTNADVPEDIIAGLAEIGGFGLSVPEEYDGFATGGESDYIGHGRRDRGAVARLARHRRLARHPARDPHPRARRRRHRGAEAGVAAAHRERRADGRHHGHRARLRLRRRRREGHRDADRRRLARQRREDVGDVRRAAPTC